ncbi:MAG: protein kinase, partial [Phycisphaerales bacterium JB038]
MPSDPDWTSNTEETTRDQSGGLSLEEVLDRYLAELAEGKQPDQEAILQAHPELAEALRGVFRTLDFVEATSRTLTTTTLREGSKLGEYRLIREVGRGGMGVVYEALQSSLGRRVALKILPASALLSENALERFIREAATAGRLHHSNIVPVYAVGEEEGIRYYAMQFINGRSLTEARAEAGADGTAPDEALCRRVAEWGRQVADALAYAHEAGVVHRDIKPSNLLVDARDHVWITDFGLARVGAHVSITLTGDVVGTARYMSPEQASGGSATVDGRGDLYSLGVTLHELITGVPVVGGESREQVLATVATSDPKPLRQVAPTAPRDLETILLKCTARDPTRRYQQAAQLADDLRRFGAGESIRAKRTPLVVRVGRLLRKHRTAVGAGTLAVLLLVLAIVTGLHFRRLRGEAHVQDAFDAVLLEHSSRRSREHLAQARRLGIDSADYHLCDGLASLMQAEPQRAMAPLERAMARAPDDVEVLLASAHAHLAVGDMLLGHWYLRQVEEADIQTPLGWLLHGYCRNTLGDPSATASFDRALRLRADFTPAIEARAFDRAVRLLVGAEAELMQSMFDDYEAWVTFWPLSPRAHA